MRWSPTIALVVAMAGLLLAVPGARAVELVGDGGFEAGGGAWVEQDSWGKRTVCQHPLAAGCSPMTTSMNAGPRSGTWWARFGGTSVLSLGQRSSIRQTVAAPSGTPLTLSFWLKLGYSNKHAALNVLLDDHVLWSTLGDNPALSPNYAQIVVPVHGGLVTGGPQTLSFEFDAVPPLLGLGYAQSISIDDVSLQIPDIDLGVGLASTPATVVQGSTFATTIAASNAGPHGADDVWVEYPLPIGATLVGLTGDAACSAADNKPGNVMHCDFGAMPGGASKAVTATLSADAVGAITQNVTVAARAGDTNAGNNAAQATVTVVPPPVAPPGEEPKPKAPTCTPASRFTVPLRKGSKGTALMIGKYTASKARILSARMTGPKKFKAKKLRHTKSKVTVDLRKLAAGRYTVRARVRVSSKKTLNVTRVYTACGAAKTSKKTTSTKSTSAKTTKSKK